MHRVWSRTCLMSAAASLAFSATVPATAETFNFPGALSGNLFWDRPNTGAPPTTTVGTTNFRFQGLNFRVTAPGSYTIRTVLPINFDTYAHLYQGQFNPKQPLTNALAADDDAGGGLSSLITHSLQGQANYVTVISSFSANVSGSFLAQITGPGSIVLSDAEIAAVGQSSAIWAGRGFLSLVGNRILGIDRAAGPQSASLGVQVASLSSGRSDVAQSGPDGAAARARETYSPLSAWVAGFGAGTRISADSSNGGSRLTGDRAGGALGVDVRLMENLFVGAAFGIGRSNYELRALGANGESTDYQVAIYAHGTWNGFYASAVLGGAWSNNGIERTPFGPPSGTATASFGISQAMLAPELGYRARWQGFDITPFVGAQVNFVHQGGYEEVTTGTGLFPMTVSSRNFIASRLLAGARVSHAFSLGGLAFVADAKAAWSHEFGRRRFVNATIAGANFVSQVDAARGPADSALLGAGLELRTGLGVRAFLRYEGQFGSRFRDHSGQGGLKLVW